MPLELMLDFAKLENKSKRLWNHLKSKLATKHIQLKQSEIYVDTAWTGIEFMLERVFLS